MGVSLDLGEICGTDIGMEGGFESNTGKMLAKGEVGGVKKGAEGEGGDSDGVEGAV